MFGFTFFWQGLVFSGSDPVIAHEQAGRLVYGEVLRQSLLMSFLDTLRRGDHDADQDHQPEHDGTDDRRDSRLASVLATKLSVLEFLKDPEGGKRALMQEGRLAVEEDGAEVLFLGCAGMAGLDGEMEEEVGVPVIHGVAAAVKIAEGLVDLNKRTSKVRAYARPETTPICGFPPIFCE